MDIKKNRRLANEKTRCETGLEYVMANMDLNTPFGKKKRKELRPFFPGEEDKLEEELAKVEQLTEFVKEKAAEVQKMQELFMEIKDISFTISRSKKTVLSVVELYEVKTLLLQIRRFLSFFDKTERLPQRYRPEDVTPLLDQFDPRGDRINTFYIYDEFSEKLGGLRQEKRKYEAQIRRTQKERREKLRKEYGILLTPKFDIVVPKSHSDLEKIKEIHELEVVDEDYMSVTFQLKPTEEVFRYREKTEAIHLLIEEEEERIQTKLTASIAEWGEILLENCRKIGELDFTMAKAIYGLQHRCTRPEIKKEHILEIEEGRNLQVEDILAAGGKKYCPVSIALEDGVTCITGANMGGKTISLKLAGQVAILAQYGFFVPCRKARVGLSNYMQILIGDSQSVERGLSSFGSEMEELKEILDRSQDRSLLLVDEIASGTNPAEGLALTKSLVEYWKKKPYITLLTTHFETVTEAEGVINMQVRGLAGVDFARLNREIQYAGRKERIDIIARYMDYRLYRVKGQEQVPKDALNIAKMLGINREIIQGAQAYMDGQVKKSQRDDMTSQEIREQEY